MRHPMMNSVPLKTSHTVNDINHSLIDQQALNEAIVIDFVVDGKIVKGD